VYTKLEFLGKKRGKFSGDFGSDRGIRGGGEDVLRKNLVPKRKRVTQYGPIGSGELSPVGGGEKMGNESWLGAWGLFGPAWQHRLGRKKKA